MTQTEINIWSRVAVDLEVAGKVDSMFYERARAIAFGEPDPMPNTPIDIPETHAEAA